MVKRPKGKAVEENTHKSGSKDKELGLGRTTVCAPDNPAARLGVEFPTDDNGVEGRVLLDTNHFVDMLKVLSKVLVVGVVVGPVPSLPDFGPGQLILRNLRVYTRSRVAVPSPSTSKTIPGLEDDSFVSSIPEGLEHKDSR